MILQIGLLVTVVVVSSFIFISSNEEEEPMKDDAISSSVKDDYSKTCCEFLDGKVFDTADGEFIIKKSTPKNCTARVYHPGQPEGNINMIFFDFAKSDQATCNFDGVSKTSEFEYKMGKLNLGIQFGTTDIATEIVAKSAKSTKEECSCEFLDGKVFDGSDMYAEFSIKKSSADPTICKLIPKDDAEEITDFMLFNFRETKGKCRMDSANLYDGMHKYQYQMDEIITTIKSEGVPIYEYTTTVE